MSSERRRFPRRTALVLGALVLVVVGQRLYTFHEPLERDLTLYAVIAHEMLDGRELYTDLWDHKPPAIFLTYAAAELVAGYGPASVFLLNVLAAVATLVGVHRAATAAFSPTAGLWAAAFWASTCADLPLQANQPNTEVFLNALVVWALAWLIENGSNPSSLRRAAAAGAALAAASLYKQLVVIPAASIVVVHLWFARGPGPGRKRAAADVALVAGMGVVAWAAVLAYFGTAGNLPEFYDAVFEHNRIYAGSLSANLATGMAPEYLFPVVLRPVAGLLILCGAGIALGARRRPRAWSLWAALAAGTFVEIVLPGKWYAHYYQLWLPVLAIGGGGAVAELAAPSRPWRRVAAHAAASAALAVILSYQVPYYRIPARDWPRHKYGPDGALFAESVEVGRRMDSRLSEGETFFAWSNEPGLYYYSRRHPPTGVLMVYPLAREHTVDRLTARVIRDLEERKPEMLVARKDLLHGSSPADPTRLHPVLSYLQTRYRPAPDELPGTMFTLFERRRN